MQDLNLIKNKLKISKLKILNKSTLTKIDKSVNGKLVNELNVLSPVQICQKTVWPLILTTTQVKHPNWITHEGTQFFQLNEHQLYNHQIY